MTNLPNDPIDPGEARLTGRVRSYTDPAVVPIDALAIAHDVAARRRRGFFARVLAPASGVARLGWIAVGALLVVAAVAGIGLAGRPGPLTGVASATPTPPPSQPTAPAVTDTPAIGACYATELSAVITSWDGAAGSRVATVELTNGGSPCTFPTRTQPQLLDAGGAGLIIGAPVTTSPTLSIPSNGHLRTMVEVGNYCGPTPVAPVTVAFVLSDGTQILATPDAHAGDVDGVPPCMGSTQPATIQMQAWQR
jgi:hypothetical protein